MEEPWGIMINFKSHSRLSNPKGRLYRLWTASFSHISILHYAKATMKRMRGRRYGLARGTVGSGLTPGTPLGRRPSEIPDPEPENPEKNGRTGSALFCSITAEPGHLQTWQGYPRIGLDLRITLVPLKIRKSGSGPS